MRTTTTGSAAACDWPPLPCVVGHRGASALRPEHTIASYAKAIEDGADFIEPDLVPTQDGVLVARHENAICILGADGKPIEATTDVADRAEFANRCRTKTIDGKTICGWFTEDFTLAELKTLRARERIPRIRPANTRFDGQFEIATLQEIIDLAKASSQSTGRNGRTVGIYPETKHPSYFRSIGLALEDRLMDLLEANGWSDRAAPVFVQSFEPSSLLRMRKRSSVRMVQLIEGAGGPFDADALDDPSLKTFGAMTTPAGLAQIARHAQAIGVLKKLVLPVDGGALQAPTTLVRDANAAGLQVHVWTLRPENAFLPDALRGEPADDPSARGDAAAEIRAFLAAGVQGLFCDDPAESRAVVGWR
ncbi:MAG: glycerophosphodiester phosphodiesterase [Burkholderiales bacterium]